MDGDHLAGIADLFGGLTREEFDRALDELSFRRDEDLDADVDEAVRDYYLVGVESAASDDNEATEVFAPGPVAFPEPPEGAEDLPHILGDVGRRDISREELATAVRNRLTTDADHAEPGSDRARYLVDVTYDAEAWAPVDLADVRAALADGD
jgi:hypothetical protein